MTSVPTMTPQGSIVPPRVGRALLIACWLTVVYGMAAAVPHVSSVRGVAAWISTVIFLGAFSYAVTRPGADTRNLVLISGLAGVAMQFLAPNNGAFVALISAIAVAGLRLDPRSSRIVAALSGIGFLAASAISAHPLSPTEVISVVPALLFTYVGSTAVRRLRVEQKRTEMLLDEVIAGRDARIRAAALDERAHLAREMHDVLAHTLSALSIQLQGTRMLAEQRSSDPAVVAAVDRAGRLAREGLGEARQAVGSLRGEALPGPDLLPQLAREFERDTGVSCSLEVEGQPTDPGPEARLALYRIAQEALTNVRKHANASSVAIAMRYGADGIELGVDNDGLPLDSPLPGGGYGVSGMRERAELLGGRLEAGPTANGFGVWLWIPKQVSVPSAS
ncbi:MAG TPA: sensor histidine kinase [Chloroflexota bacterium]